MLGWYVVWCKAAQEYRAGIELTNQGFRAYVPIIWGRPAFPRYIFLQMDRDKDPWGLVRSTRGCIDLLKSGFQPVSVPDDCMASIMALRDVPEPIQTDTEFTRGQKVMIVEGPCKGFEALFVADEKKHVYALLEVMGRPIKVARQSIRAA